MSTLAITSDDPDQLHCAAEHLAASVSAFLDLRYQDAELEYQAARSLQPGEPIFQSYLSAYEFVSELKYVNLQVGDYQAGGAFGRARYFVDARRDMAWIEPLGNCHSQWSGDLEKLRGNRLLVVCYEGYGDLIQFCRFIPVMVAAGAKVTIACQEVLWPLIRNFGLDIDLVAPLSGSQPAPEHDLWTLLGDRLPDLFDVREDTIPFPEGYLKADPERARYWHDLLPVGPKVGLVWGGTATNPWDPHRSIPAANVAITLSPLLRVPGISFVSLQVGPRSEEVALLPGVIDATPLLTDYGETAALIANLDLVITVETSVAHLAGAMGKPVWIMIAEPTCWRWMLGRPDSPWYRSARLFRQTRSGDWTGVVEEMVIALEAWAAEQGSYRDGRAPLCISEEDWA